MLPRLRMLMVPATPWRPAWNAFQQGCAPNPTRLFDIMAAEHGIDTTLIDPGGWPWNPLAGRHQVLCGIDPVRAIRIALWHNNADLVLACFEPGAVSLLALRRLVGFRARVAVIDIGLTEEWALRERMLDFVVPRCDAIYPLGSNQVEYIHRRWRTEAEVRFIHQHVDTEFYHPRAAAANGSILSVGDDHGRDFDTLLRAFAGLDAKLLLKTQLVKSAVANVQLLPERLSGVVYRDLFAQARFVVVPLRPMLTASGVGTILEAAAMGKALIISDSPGIRDYVVHNETALLVPCGDAAAMRAAILRLMREPETVARLGAAARSFAERCCSYAAHAAKLSQALRELVHRHPNSPALLGRR